MSHDVEAAAAIQSMVDLRALLAVRSYEQFVGRGIMTRDEASAALKEDADIYEAMDLPAPIVGAAVAYAVRDYAAKVFEGRPGGDTPPPRLRLVE